MDKKIVFLHIPKSGGTTFKSLLYKKYGRKKSYQFNSYRIFDAIEEFRKMPLHKKREYSVIEGHFANGIERYLCVSEAPVFITFLREPVKRVISYWKHLKRLPLLKGGFGMNYKYIKDGIDLRELSLEEFIKGDYSYEIDNGQLRYLASVDGKPVSFERKRCMDIQDLKRAKRNLMEKYSFGITEKYPESLLLLKEEMLRKGIDLEVEYQKKLNQSPNKVELSKKEVELIKGRNSLDAELYEFAYEIFHEKLRKYFGKQNLAEKTKSVKQSFNCIAHSRKLRQIKEALSKIDRRSRVVVYGAGEHTYRLLKSTDLKCKNIECIVDTYEQDGDMLGIKVKNAKELGDIVPDVVIISSFAFQEEIYRYLTKEIGYNGLIVKFYDENDTEVFYV